MQVPAVAFPYIGSMKSLMNGIYWVYTGWVAIVFVSLMLLTLPFFMLSAALLSKRANLWVATTLMLFWFRLFMLLVFIRHRVRNAELIQGVKPCVYVGNHSSFLDVPTVKSALGYGFLPLGKKEQTKLPILGWIYAFNVILIDRSSETSRKASMEAMRQLMRDKYSILIFPEGTMNRTPYLIKSFYDGAFRLAIELQVPIIPFANTGVRNLMTRGSLRLRPGACETVFGPPISTTGLTEADVPTLKRQVFDAMWALLSAHATPDTIGLGGPKPNIDPEKKRPDA